MNLVPTLRTFASFLLIAGLSGPAFAADTVADALAYQGRLQLSGTNLNGSYHFKFSLVDGTDSTVLWTNDGGQAGAGGEPAGSVVLTVTNGLFRTTLGGDPMVPVPPTVFARSKVLLRVWVQHAGAYVELTPASEVSPVGAALVAKTVVDGAIGTAALADGAVTLVKIDAAAIASLGIAGPAGPAGPAGAVGPTGPTGPAGAAGTAGAVWLSGASDPTTEGANGDYFLNTATGDVFTKTAGSWGGAIASLVGPQGAQGLVGLPGADGTNGADGAQGPAGPAGANGAIWLSGAVDPVSEGADGDYYLNTATGDVFTKTTGSWGIPIASLLGPAGANGTDGTNGVDGAPGTPGAPGSDGATWLSGAVDPVSEGADGDYFLNTATGDVFTKTAGSWGIPIASLLGPAGTNGANGADGTNGANGADGTDGATWLSGAADPTTEGTDGDFFLNTTTGDVFTKTAGSWGTPITSLVGPTGADGAAGSPGAPGADGAAGATGAPGTAGANGATWLTGTGVPSSSLGVNGDLYLDTDAADVYRKSSGSWGSAIANLHGKVDKVVYTVARPHTLTVPAAAFRGQVRYNGENTPNLLDPSQVGRTNSGRGGIYLSNVGYQDNILSAPVTLPDGAVITSMTVIFKDRTPDYDFDATLVGLDLKTDATADIAFGDYTVFTDPTTTGDPVAVKVDAATPVAAEGLALEVQVSSTYSGDGVYPYWPTDGDLVLNAVQITYELSEAQ